MNYVGIDHHRQYSHMTMMDREGQVLRTARVPINGHLKVYQLWESKSVPPDSVERASSAVMQY